MPHQKVQEAARSILEAFETGTLPSALAQVFLYRGVTFPCSQWSWRNRLLIALRGHSDARGFRQWKEVGRHVRAGERATYILVPCFRKREDDDNPTDEPRLELAGYTAAAVFGYAQTEGEPLPEHAEADTFLATLPLREVAERWGLHTAAYSKHTAMVLSAAGFYDTQRIALGVTNKATWCHELVHAADDRLGTLNRAEMEAAEVVAELGGAVLLELLGETIESDRGGAWSYICQKAESADQKPLTLCTQLLDRVCSCVDLILRTADEITAETAPTSCSQPCETRRAPEPAHPAS